MLGVLTNLQQDVGIIGVISQKAFYCPVNSTVGAVGVLLSSAE